jgi:hypothetical protein
MGVINPPRSFPLYGGTSISTATSMLGVFGNGINAVSTAWPSANLAIFIPIRVPSPVMVCKLAMGAGATAAGNFDMGIYDRFGNLLVSSGATAKSATTEQILDVRACITSP